MGENKLISIVIPVYNSEKIVEKTVNTILENTDCIINYDFEIILVNDCSPDNSWNIISNISRTKKNIKSINLLKNYGQHSAVFCGFKYCKGDYIITMDDDLQNPPSEIIKLVNKIEEGHDLVFAKFEEKKHSFTRRIGSKIIGYLNFKIFNKPKNITLTNFRIFTKDVLSRVLEYKTAYPYIPGLLLMFSSSIANVTTLHAKREIGNSNYNLLRILSLVSRLIFNYSSYPLKSLTYLGISISVTSFFMGFFYFIRAFFLESKVVGWTSLIVLSSFLNGFLILMVGILGEYVTRVMKQTSSSNSIIVKEVS